MITIWKGQQEEFNLIIEKKQNKEKNKMTLVLKIKLMNLILQLLKGKDKIKASKD